MRYVISAKKDSMECEICQARKAATEINKLQTELARKQEENKERYERMNSYLEKIWHIDLAERFNIIESFPKEDVLSSLASIGVRPKNPLTDVPYNTIDVREYAALVRNILQFKTGIRHGIVVFGQKATYLRDDLLFFGIAPEITVKRLATLDHTYDFDKEELSKSIKSQFSFLTSTRAGKNYTDNSNFPTLPIVVKDSQRTLTFQSHTRLVTNFHYCADLRQNFEGPTSVCNSDYLAQVLLSIAIYKRRNKIVDFTGEQYDEILRALFYKTADVKRQAKGLTPKKLILK